ncbi:hypothetical protein L1I79_05620 [Strepomyces sp. STD 3.1]|nr:hypothetical protein [Streptomyces sp. STD 3.1]
MRTFVRACLTGCAATLLAVTTSTSAHAGEDIAVFAPADWNEAPKDTWGGKANFKAYGEILSITDMSSDGHSVVAVITYPGGGTQYWWNSNGAGTTRKVDLEIAENGAVYLRACLAEWSGTPTGGIMWDKCGSGSQGSA